MGLSIHRRPGLLTGMGQRITRVNVLLQREISTILRTQFTAEAVTLTITGADVSADLRQARIYYTVLGDTQQRRLGGRFLQNKAKEIRYQLGRRIVLKYLPALHFVEDQAAIRGHAVGRLLDDLDGASTKSEERV